MSDSARLVSPSSLVVPSDAPTSVAASIDLAVDLRVRTEAFVRGALKEYDAVSARRGREGAARGKEGAAHTHGALEVRRSDASSCRATHARSAAEMRR
jgi:hypothetical protein